MTQRIHLSIVQPPGYIHSLGFLDQARFVRHHFRRLGTKVTIGKNRLREDAVNIIFGAHLGFQAQLKERFTCVFFNLEQLGEGGAIVSKAYMDLLSSSAVIDYDIRNLAAYGCKEGDVPVITFQFAPYLCGSAGLSIEERPIDLLFFGGINDRRLRIFDRIEACGWNVSFFDHPIYSEERDHYIKQSKAVFNCHFYETNRFEQARAFHTLSLGTPVISERTEHTTPPPAFEESVSWVSDDNLEDFFTNEFMTPQWQQRAQQQLHAFSQTDADGPWNTAHNYCQGLWGMEGEAKATKIWHPVQMNLGSGKDYKSGWFNVDILERALPDLVLDLGKTVTFPINAPTLGGGRVFLEANSLSAIYANNVLEHVPDLPCLMTNLLDLLKEDGLLELEVPYEKSMTAWQDPTHLRAMNENSWLYYTSWFWYLGWFEYRFEMVHFQWLDCKVQPCEENDAAFMKVKLKKICTTPDERLIARTMLPDFGGLMSDITGEQTTIKVTTNEPMNVNRRTAYVSNDLPCTQIATTSISPPNALVVIGKPTSHEKPYLDAKLLGALPEVKKVLEIGRANSVLGNAYLERYPEAQWMRVDDDLNAIQSLDGIFDMLVLSNNLPTKEILEITGAKTTKNSQLFTSVKNAASWGTFEQLLLGCVDANEAPVSIASAYKLFLDTGWMPTLIDQNNAELPSQRIIAAMDQLADAYGVPRQTAHLNLNIDRAIIHAVRAFDEEKRKPGQSEFSVVVPTTRESQLRANVELSPGLQEVGAQIITYRGATNPAEALTESLAHCDAQWVLFCHQDVYFPHGFGEQLNAVLSEVPKDEQKKSLFGFIGIGVNRDTLACEPKGFAVDRMHRADHPESDAALSIDELAIVIAKKSIHQIDPTLGWHLWATDLCLTSICTHNTFPRIVRLPIFHNSLTDYCLPSAFDKSAALLKDKFPEFGPIHTLCKVII